MATRKILTEGDPTLEKHSHPVTKFDDKLHALLDDMRETMTEAHGAGLAAPQVGILRRAVLVMNDEDEILELINPEIVSATGEQDGLEGCLSIPGYYGFVKRPNEVTVRARDRHGKPFTASGTGLTARAFCHETEHLDGLLYTRLVEGKLMTGEEVDRLIEEEERAAKKEE
ncbi:MAG TPA: peptide deformylase [Oscillospiraceae bacterium]|nr:peptide deformylase [Oscillospiraceae bacterium]